MMVKRTVKMCLMLFALAVLAACFGGDEPEIYADLSLYDERLGADFVPQWDISGESLVVYTTYGAAFAEPIVAAFEEATGARVDIVMAGTGALLTRLREAADDPQADILWGAAMFTVLPDIALFEDYTSINEPYILPHLRNTEGPLTRFSASGRLLMVNTGILGEIGVEITGYGSLLQPELRGRIAITNPATSGSSFNHLVNQLYAMGGGNPHDGWDYIRAFIQNLDGIMLPDSSDVYRGVASGDFAVGLTFEEAPWSFIQDGAPVDVVYIYEGIIATSSSVAVVAGAPNRAAAQIFVDFVTSYDVQRIMEPQLFRRPVRADVPSQGVFPDNDDLNWLYYDIEYVLSNREAWLAKFAEIWEEQALISAP